jgi:ammonium transporter, Amt family
MTETALLTIWTLFCASLVLLMQAGFICFESGNVRNKNSVNVALKNVSNFCICAFLYWAFGYALMFGSSGNAFVGSSGFFFENSNNPFESSFFLFQLMFCCTSATIISGAVAERMRFTGYIIITILTTSLVYPLFGHWAWGGRILGDLETNLGWLLQLGFIDFAGATVVHSVGGWIALAAILVIGPRLGRFNNSEVTQIYGDNLPLTALGTCLLFLGWFGFNGGSYGHLDAQLASIFIHTAVAGVTGGLVVLLICTLHKSLMSIRFVLNGVLAGLVGITACANGVNAVESAYIGGVAGALSYQATKLLERLKIDDVVGVVPSHLVGGIWGTLSVALFADPALFSPGFTRLEQLGVQVLGIIVCALMAFVLPYLLFHLINGFYPLRVSARVEIIGLNFGEFGLTNETLKFIQSMRKNKHLARKQGVEHIDVFSELGLLEVEYNELIEQINTQQAKSFSTRKKLSLLARTDHLTGLANRQGFDYFYGRQWRQARRSKKPFCLLLLDIDHFKLYNDTYGHQQGDECLHKVAQALNSVAKRPNDYVARVGGEEFAIILPDTDLAAAEKIAEDIFSELVKLNIAHRASPTCERVTVSVGLAMVPFDTKVSLNKEYVYRCADKALYEAKDAGRNGLRSKLVTQLSGDG